MTTNQRSAVGLSLALIAAAAAPVLISLSRHIAELPIQLMGLAALLLSIVAVKLLRYSQESRSGRVAYVFAVIVSAWCIFEFGIGFAWYTLDKLVRHYQHA